MGYLIKKLTFMGLSLFMVITITFGLMKMIPGDPFNDEKALPKEIHEALRAHYGLEDPLITQYLNYLSKISKGDLGPSFKYKGRSINEVITTGFPVSMALGLESLFIAIGGGIILGSCAAMRKNGWIDRFAVFFCTLGVALPNFAIAALLQYFLSIKLEIFPVARWGSFSQSILPSISLAALPMAFITRLVRNSMIEVLQQPYIKTAKAKGLSDWKILRFHVLKNSILPLLGYLGQLSANIIVGSFVIEKIFSIPGLGQWFVKSVMNRDYTMIMGLTIFYSLILLFSVLFFDLLSLYLDPRLKLKNTRPPLKAAGAHPL